MPVVAATDPKLKALEAAEFKLTKQYENLLAKVADSWEFRDSGPWPSPTKPPAPANVPWFWRPHPKAKFGMPCSAPLLLREIVSNARSPFVFDWSPYVYWY